MLSRWRLVGLSTLLVVCAVFAMGDAFEKKPPKDEDPPPAGTIYYSVSGTGYYSMSTTGSDKTYLFGFLPVSEAVPSYGEHGGYRWFLERKKPAEDEKYALVARREDETETQIWSDADAKVMFGQHRWAKDDSYVYFQIFLSATGTSQILKASVDWSSGTPVLGPTTPIFAFEAPAGTWVVRNADISPGGGMLVYESYQTDGRHLIVRVLGSDSTTDLGSGHSPEWSPDGNRITFVRNTPKKGKIKSEMRVYTIDPDGTDLENVVAGDYPNWSPDSEHLVFQKSGDIQRIKATGGDPVNLTTDIGTGLATRGWR